MAPTDGVASQRSGWPGVSDGSWRCGSDCARRTGAPASDWPSKNGIIARIKAGTSSALRLESQFRSRTTSSLSQIAPALTMSSRTPGHEVSVRLVTRPLDASSRGAWDSTAIGLPSASMWRTRSRAWALWRSRSGLM